MVGFVQDLASVGTMENHKITCVYAEVDPKHPIVEPASSLALPQNKKLKVKNAFIFEIDNQETRTRGKAGNKFLKA
jgi:hypothetical protein